MSKLSLGNSIEVTCPGVGIWINSWRNFCFNLSFMSSCSSLFPFTRTICFGLINCMILMEEFISLIPFKGNSVTYIQKFKEIFPDDKLAIEVQSMSSFTKFWYNCLTISLPLQPSVFPQLILINLATLCLYNLLCPYPSLSCP